MASTSNFEAKVLMSKGKRATAAYVHADCAAERNPKHLKEVLDNLLNPIKPIDNWETIDWCKWLMAGGRTPDEFASTVHAYDNATTCGLVWTPNFVAYRCRTCGISPCMSLCTDCFKKGNHHRHDFNMFLSQAGGACDCGDTSVMKATGFCDRHGPDKTSGKGNAPNDLMCVAEAMMPRIIFRLIQHLREYSAHMGFNLAIQDSDAFITMLLDFNNMGGLMRRVMTSALTNPTKYRLLNEVPDNMDSEYAQYLAESKRFYERGLESLPNPEQEIGEDLKDCPSLQRNLVHRTFLEELVFWTVKFEFPQKVVCLLLNMLPDPDYKEALTRAFVLHYSRISIMLENSADPDTLSNRVVHVSVQLFSNESLALRMTEQLNLLHVMVVSLKSMMSKILIRSTLHYPEQNTHSVVDCAKPVMKDHCYWPLVSDLNNVLSHRPVALKFMADDSLLEMWFSFLSMFQGMNVNQRELNQHIEFEPNTYYAAFSAELEASAYPMWALVTHLTDSGTAQLTRRVLSACLKEWYEWLESTNYKGPIVEDSMQVSFHLPLHRYLAVFLCQGVAKQGIRIEEILPSNDTMLTLLIMHPLRVQVSKCF
ncbi:E3 ubiquitin-protein ligase Ubr3-like [Anthonomus grandis grandis]|uniref:E3 ubiquitin-protein ligase Ubr3-like n=1 Tax=Anthonomus grandis grandis TaxID=2921223 RepID=UPI0021656AEF|nr:E3 ubiquitin-protein ligase Ubr3-like [Anthonomus grandis grandis]